MSDEYLAQKAVDGDMAGRSSARAMARELLSRRARDAGDAAARSLASRLASWTDTDLGRFGLVEPDSAYRAAIARETNDIKAGAATPSTPEHSGENRETVGEHAASSPASAPSPAEPTAEADAEWIVRNTAIGTDLRRYIVARAKEAIRAAVAAAEQRVRTECEAEIQRTLADAEHESDAHAGVRLLLQQAEAESARLRADLERVSKERDDLLLARHEERRVPEARGGEALWAEVSAEVARATRKFPTWPTDPLHAAAVVQEECGELGKAALECMYEAPKSTVSDVRKEAVQTAAMALRFLASITAYDWRRGHQHAQNAARAKEAP